VCIRALVAWVLFSLSGCAVPSRAVTIMPAEKEARLVFEVRGQPFKVGVVRAVVGGVPTLALIDTGAGRHVISTTLARRIGKPLIDTHDTTADPAGRILPLVVADAAIELEGLGALPAQPPVVIDLPGIFDELGIGLILSPQRAVEDGQALRIDYRTGALTRIVDPPMSIVPRPGHWPAPGRCGGPTDQSGPFYLVDAKIDGEAVALTLDTGADATCVFGGAPIAQVLRSRYRTTADQAYGAGGAIQMRRTPEILVHVGKVATLRALPILPREAHGACGQDGHLGLDVLRSCVIVISRDHASVECPS
jgi:hypothetical protein